MAKLGVVTDAFLSINAVTLSSFVRSCRLTEEYDVIETTTMGNTQKEWAAGFGDGTLEVTWAAAVATGEVLQTLEPLTGTAVAFIHRNASGAVSTSNPQTDGTVLIGSLTWFDNDVGALAENRDSWKAYSLALSTV